MSILLAILAFVSWVLGAVAYVVKVQRDPSGKVVNAVRLPKRWAYERYYAVPIVVGFILMTAALLTK